MTHIPIPKGRNQMERRNYRSQGSLKPRRANHIRLRGLRIILFGLMLCPPDPLGKWPCPLGSPVWWPHPFCTGHRQLDSLKPRRWPHSLVLRRGQFLQPTGSVPSGPLETVAALLTFEMPLKSFFHFLERQSMFAGGWFIGPSCRIPEV